MPIELPTCDKERAPRHRGTRIVSPYQRLVVCPHISGHAEAIVDAELDDMHVLVDVDPHILLAALPVQAHARRNIECLSAEVHVIVFEFGRPVMPERPLGAATNNPAGARITELRGGEIVA